MMHALIRKLRRDILSVPAVGGPIMHAVKVHAGGKEVGVAAQAKRGEVATIASSPQADALGIDVRPALQEFPGNDDVLVFTRATAGAAGRFAERAAITNAAPIVQRENHMAAAREILIHSVGIRE